METKWTEAIHTTPAPEPGVLTERALAKAPQKSRRALRPYAYGSLALAATLPLSLLLLPKPNTLPEPEPRVALMSAKQSLSLEKRQSDEVRAVLQPKIARAQHPQTSLPKQNTARGLSLSVTPDKEKVTLLRSRLLSDSRDTKTELLRLQESPLAESKPPVFGFQKREVVKESVQANEEPLLRLARGGEAARGLSALSASSGERGTQLALVAGKRLSEVEGTPLTLLPNAPSYENPQLKTALTRWPDGQVEGTLSLEVPRRGGVIPKAYLVYVAAFDAKGTLVSTAQTELPGAGGTASVKLGLAPTAQHYQLALFAKPAPPKEELVVAGYLVRHLVGDVLSSSTSQITLHKPQFYESNYYKTLSADLSVSTVNLADAAGYTVHGALFDEKGRLLSTDQAPLQSPKSIISKPLQAEYSQEVWLGFGVTGQHAARYQLAVTAPVPKPQNFRLSERLVAQVLATPDSAAGGLSVVLKPELSGLTPRVAMRLPDDPEALRQHAIQTEQSLGLQPQTARTTFNLNLNLSTLNPLAETAPKAPDARFMVASALTGPDGSLVLRGRAEQYPMEEVFKNPKLRDYTQVKLTPSVVAALKAKGITEFVGKTVLARGKSETSLYLSRPAFEVTTVTVEKIDDVTISMLQPILLPHGTKLAPDAQLRVIQQGQAQDFLRRLREAKDGQGRYPLLISPEFNEVLLAAAECGDEATVIELVQWSWFGGPSEAAKGGNGVTWAAYCPTIEPVKALLERGVSAGVADASGNTGLHRTYRPEIAALLLKHKAPTEIKNTDGETPLLSQARQADRWLGRLGVVQALLAAGANPNATDNQGRTPLMWAAKSGLPDLVEALLKKGADPKRKDKDGKTARDYTAAWPWGTAPGLLTVEGAAQLQRDSEADRARVEQLLGGR